MFKLVNEVKFATSNLIVQLRCKWSIYLFLNRRLKGAKVYPASRRRSNKRVGLARKLALTYIAILINVTEVIKQIMILCSFCDYFNIIVESL